VSNGKDVREKKHNKIKWVIDDQKEVANYLNDVSAMMEHSTSPALHAGLFCKDFKKQVRLVDAPTFRATCAMCNILHSPHTMRQTACTKYTTPDPSTANIAQVDAIKELSAFIPSHPDALTSNVDLVLKMCSLRLMGKGSNTSVSLAVLELLRTTLECLVSSDYRLTEVEASVCLPCLMEEVGCNNEHQKQLIREILKKATQVCAPRPLYVTPPAPKQHVTSIFAPRFCILSTLLCAVSSAGLPRFQDLCASVGDYAVHSQPKVEGRGA
jgi:hypothetical protein